MRYFVAVIILFLSVSSILPQSKYFIYFKDKGPELNSKNYRETNEYSSALNELSERAISRRSKHMPADQLIKFEDLPIYEKYIREIEKLNIPIITKLNWFNSVSSILNSEELELISSLDFVESVKPVRKYKIRKPDQNDASNGRGIQSILSDVYNYGNSYSQYALSDIPKIHNMGITGEGILIGMLDTGFKWKDHPVFNHMNIISEYDFINDDGITENENGEYANQHNHGTAVLSVIGGFVEGVLIGPAIDASYILAKTENAASEKNIEEDHFIAGLEWIENQGADIVSSSLGYYLFDSGEDSYSYEDMNGETALVTQASEMAFERGLVVITSAGNEGNNFWHYILSPADGFNIIAVGAVDTFNNIAGFSSRGPSFDGRIKPDVVADGVRVIAAQPSIGLYSTASGTSFSAPIVSGIAAQLLSVYPHLTNVQVRDLIIKSGDNYDSPNNDRGYGLVSAVRLLSYPNVEVTNSGLVLNKIFIAENEIIPSSAQIHITRDGFLFDTFDLDFDGEFKFTHLLSNIVEGDSIQFYFSAITVNGSHISEPTNGYYKFTAGNLLVHKVNSNFRLNESELPDNYELRQNYPNPFNFSTFIEFVVVKSGYTEIFVYDLLGRKVRKLFSDNLTPGAYRISWDGVNNNGRLCSSGPYIYTMTSSGKQISKKMLLLK